MQIYWNKRKRLHKKRVQLPEDWFGTPTWPPFHCFGTPDMAAVKSCENTLFCQMALIFGRSVSKAQYLFRILVLGLLIIPTALHYCPRYLFALLIQRSNCMHYFCQNYAILFPQIGLLFINFSMDYQRLVHAARVSLAL